MEILCQISEIIRRDGLALWLSHGHYLYQNFSGLFDGMEESESQIKVFSGSEQAVMRPDSGVIPLHQFAGGYGNVRPAPSTERRRRRPEIQQDIPLPSPRALW